MTLQKSQGAPHLSNSQRNNLVGFPPSSSMLSNDFLNFPLLCEGHPFWMSKLPDTDIENTSLISIGSDSVRLQVI